MRNTLITRHRRRYLTLLTALVVSAALVSGSGLHSTGYAGYSSGGNVSGNVAVLECRQVGANATLEEATWFLTGDAGGFQVSIMVRPSGSGPDVTTLYLDRDGADIPEGNWWGISGDANSATLAGVEGHRGPDITTLNLDRNGADISAD